MNLDPLGATAVLLTGLAVALIAAWAVPPTRRLAGRVRPYTVTARTSLGRSADVRSIASPDADASTFWRLFGPPLEALAARLSSLLDQSSEEALHRKLQQAGVLTGVPHDRRVAEYRLRQLANGAAGGGLGLVAAVSLALRPSVAMLLVVAGLVAGVTRWRARVDRAIEERRARMRVELYTVNQLIAMNVRVGGGVIQAVQRVVERGNGVLVDELAEVLRAHGSGVNAAEAFTRAAAATPEPHVARTYRLLAAGAEYGADLGEALLAHSEDVREARREALRRTATKRRAGMLVPIIAILAPVMLLFIAAPLPSMVLFQP